MNLPIYRCRLPLIPIRKEAKHSSEMVSEILYGEQYTIIESNGYWIKIKMEFDGYEGWIFSRKNIETDENCSQISSHFQVFEDEKLGKLFLTPGTEIIGDTPLPFQATPDKIVSTAKIFLNTPYLWGGRSIWGIDCSGLSQIIYKINGISILRDAYQQAEQGFEITNTLNNVQAGDLVFFAEISDRITHVGILTGEGTIIHASDYVREDKIDENGIFNSDINQYTLKPILIKRYL